MSITIFYLLIWFLSYILYPIWYLPSQNLFHSFSTFFLFMAIFIILAKYILPPIKNFENEKPIKELIKIPEDKFLKNIILLTIISRIYFLFLPIWGSIGDELYHVAFPALFFKILPNYINYAIHVFSLSGIVMIFIFRKKIITFLHNISFLKKQKIIYYILAVFLLLIYFSFLYKTISYFTINGHTSLPRDILRFPPLSRIIRFFIYLFFGVSNFTARFQEFVFFILAQILIYKTALELYSKIGARISLILFSFISPLSYFSIKGAQVPSEMFFFILIFYFFILWEKTYDHSFLIYSVFAVAIGFLYRYTVLVAGIILVFSFFKALHPINKENFNFKFLIHLALAGL